MNRDQADSLRAAADDQLSRWKRPKSGVHHCRVIAVSGGKGGVGKTNIAVNLSLAMQEAGARVLLLDADLGLANVDVILGINPEFTLQHVIRREIELSQIVVQGPLGLNILPGGTGLPDLANLNTLEVVRLISSLRALEREHDVLVIDTAAGIGTQVTKFALAADDVIVVTTPEPPAMLDAYGLLKALNQHNAKNRLHLLINMVKRRGEDSETFRSLGTVAEHYLGLRLHSLGGLPRDDSIVQCVKKQVPFYLANGRSATAARLREIAGFFLAGMSVGDVVTKESFFARLLESMR